MSAEIKTLALAIILGLVASFPVLAAEEMTMEQIVAMCEKASEDQDDPDAFFEKCVEEKSAEAQDSAKAE